MDSIDLILLCLYAPFALLVLWVLGCLFFGRAELVPRFIVRWLEKFFASKASKARAEKLRKH